MKRNGQRSNDGRGERSRRSTRASGAEGAPRRQAASRSERAERPVPARPSERLERPVQARRTEREERTQRRSATLREDLIYGRNPVLEAVRAGRVRRVLMARTAEADVRLDEIRSHARKVDTVDGRTLDRLAPGGVHQGVIAEVAPRRFETLRELLAGRPDLLVALDSVLDPQNLGAILRSAEAAGAGGVILPARRTAPLSAVAAKASSGASEHLRIAQVAGLPSAVSDVRRAGIWCVALDPRGEMAAWEFDFRNPVCVIVGGEGAGVHRLVRERSDARVRLPMRGRVGSYNASAAAAALLYEVLRQRSTAADR